MIASAQVGKSTTLCHLTFTQLLSLDAIAACCHDPKQESNQSVTVRVPAKMETSKTEP